MKDNEKYQYPMTRKDAFKAPIDGLGKIPPQAIELEEAVLGAIMLEKTAITLVGALLKPDIFYKEQNRLVYQAIVELDKKSDPIDLLTVTDMLRKMGLLDLAGGPIYVTELTSGVSSSANIEYHTRLLQEAWMKRESIRFAQKLLQTSFDDTSDPFDIVDLGTQYVLDMTSSLDNGKTVEFKPAVMEYLEELGIKMNMKGEVTGIPSGIKAVDKAFGGWQNQDLIIIAARVAMGKTSFVTRSLISAAKAGFPVAMFSLEMSNKQLIDRILGQELRIVGASRLKKGDIREYEFNAIIQRANDIYNLPIYIDDTAGIRLSEIRAKAYNLVRTKGVKMIAIDYLQLVTADDKGIREQEISSISRGLKKLAKELNVPIIALSQLSRAVETRGGDKRPQLSDLRESGAIEQDADIVCFLYRPEYYNIMVDADGNSTEGIAELIPAKNRNGGNDPILMKWIGQYTDFQDLPETDGTEPFNPEIFDTGYANRFNSDTDNLKF
jgi:replicative DNA helicase